MSRIGEGALIAGRYRLEDRLDAEGRSQIWSASDQELARRVAVKILLTSEASDASFVEEFREEAQLEAGLKHPGIVEVYDWGQDGDANYIVMELLDGTTVARLLEGGPILPERVVTLGRHVADALAFAHAAGIAHGSIGPDKVFLAPAGRSASLIGFGLQCRGACEYPAVPDADTYALGALMYQALTGVSPLGPRPGNLPGDAPWPEHPHKLNPEIPRELDRVVMKAVSADPAERYHTPLELKAALEEMTAPRDRSWLWIPVAAFLVLIAVAAGWLIFSQMKVVVPDVTRQPVAEAKATLSSAGFEMVVTGQVASTELPAGVVVSETPTAGAQARRGSQVGVTVSTGKPTVAVPGVVGVEFKSASSTIAGAGLVVGEVTNQTSTTFPADTVLSQDPPAGQQLAVGGTVNLVVSSGKETVTLPDVRGLNQTDATNKLRNLGLLVDPGAAYSSQPSGIVISQGPPAGTAVPAGSTVTISVSKGPAPVKVPDVVGALKSDAVSSLENVGLVPVSVPHKRNGQSGRASHRPDSQRGNDVARGSQVKLLIGK